MIVMGGYGHHGFSVPLTYPNTKKIDVLHNFFGWEEHPPWVTFFFPEGAFLSVREEWIRSLPMSATLH